MRYYPFIFSDEKKYRLQRHITFWVFWWLFQGFLYAFINMRSLGDYIARLPVSMTESLVFMTMHIFLAYSLMYFVIPRYLLKQRYWQAILWTAFLCLATATISAVLANYVINPIRESFYGVGGRPASASFGISLMAGLRGGLTIGGIACAIKLMKYWYIKEQRNLQLQKENVESRLQLLKAQVHPHFLFNTLNNIYSFSQKTSPEAAKMVSDLSDLLRFMLYEASQSQIPLSKELKMIRDYIGLEKIRYGNKLDLHIDLPEDTNDLQIAPLLLLPLVENCFKHGTSNVLEQPWISLQIELEGKQMQMKLLNGKEQNRTTAREANGIGIQNVQNRLALLYTGKHELLITDDEDVFILNLKVELEQQKESATKTVKIQDASYA